MTTLSTMMSRSIDQGEAPMALRMPNSRVRSRTVISMMFDTPTIPDSSVNSPTIHSAVLISQVAVLSCKSWVNRFHIQMVRSSSVAARCWRLIRAR